MTDTTAHAASTAIAANGLYFGTSDSPDGRRAWLVRFNGAASGGRLYAPPDNPALSPLPRRAPADAVAFRSEPGLGDVYYVLVARSTVDGIVGTIETMRARRRGADTVVARAEGVRLHMIPAGVGPLAGVFSNVAMNEESGDPNGFELVLLEAQPGRWAAVLTVFDGDLTPRAATEVTPEGAGVRFAVQSSDGTVSYAAAPAGRALLVRSTRGEADTLARRTGLAEFLVGGVKP